MTLYPKEILDRVRAFAALQYDIGKIVKLINPEDYEQFKQDIQDETHVLFHVYNQGIDHGKFKLDAALLKLQSAEADKALLEVKRQREVDNAVAEYLGETTKEE
jgi:hypothetical protein